MRIFSRRVRSVEVTVNHLIVKIALGFALIFVAAPLTGCRHEVNQLPSIEIKGETVKASSEAQAEQQALRVTKAATVGLAGVITMLLILAVPLACMRWVIPHVEGVGGVLLASVLCLGVAGLEVFGSDAAARLGLIPWLVACNVVPAVVAPCAYLASKNKMLALWVYGLPVLAYAGYVAWSVFDWICQGLLAESVWMLVFTIILIVVALLAGVKKQEAAAN